MRTSLLVLLTTALMALGASAASAAISIDESGTTIVLYDATLSNETVIGYDAGEVTVQNTDGSGFGVLLVPGGDCHFLSDNEVGCPVASFGDLDATYAGGRDQFHVELCGLPITLDLGEGVNNYYGAECPSEGAIEVRGGSGQDTFAGASGGATNETFLGGGGNDTLHGYGGDDDIRGGEGNDIADGGPGDDQVFGDGGNDVLTGDTGDDVEDGGPGDDNIGGKLGLSSGRDDDQGADTLRGGTGTDNLVLESHTGGVTITLDGQANDGSPSEGDNVAADFEHIDGTGADDVFTGSAGNDGFSGGGGADLIHGGDGADDLAGDGGGDRVFGDAGNDVVEGTNGADIVDGGPGADQIYGDIANCSVFCNLDADQLFARDGERDVVDCGGGADSAQVDSLDVVAFCSVVDGQGPPPGPGPGPITIGLPPAFTSVVAKSVKLKKLIQKGLSLRFTCAAACKVTATLSFKGKTLGAGRKTLRKAGTAKLVVRVAKKSRARVRRLKGKKLTLRLKVVAGGRTTKLTRTVKLKR